MDNRITRFVIIGDGDPTDYYIFSQDGDARKDKFETDYDINLLVDYLEDNGIDINEPDAIQTAIDKGILERYNSDNIDKIEQVEIDYQEACDNMIEENEYEDFEEEYEDSDEEYENSGRKLSKRAKAGIAAGAIALGAAGAGVGIYASTNKDNKQSDQNQQVTTDINTKDSKINATDFDGLMSKFEDNNQRKLFASSVFNTVEKLNTLTGREKDAIYKTENGVNEYVFSLDKDVSIDPTTNKEKQEYLQFTYDEVAAAKIVLNNYTSEQLFEIYGNKEIDTQTIMNNYQSFAGKIQLYYMNAKANSGISNLIEDKANRDWFEQIEETIVEFNKNVNSENADKVIRTFEYFYEYDINGTDNVNTNVSSINAVKNIAYQMLTGYYNANINGEYEQYLTVSSEPGELDNKYQTEKLAQVQKGEKLIDILDRAGKENCTLSLVQQHIDNEVNSLRTVQSEKKQANDNYSSLIRMNLSQFLIDNGKAELASKVMVDGVTEGLRTSINKLGEKASAALSVYDISMSNMPYSDTLPTYDQIKTVADKELGPYADLNFTVIMVNRQRGKTLDLTLTTDDMVTLGQWNNMTADEQYAYAQENGELVSQTTDTVTEDVSRSDLTSDELAAADQQIAEIEAGMSSENAYAQGQIDANSYANSGDYSYSGTIINNVNPDAPEDVTYMATSLVTATQLASAFGGSVPTSGDSQIQSRLESDAQRFQSNNSVGSDAVSSYRSGWLSQINTELQAAVQQGQITIQEAEEAYQNALSIVEEKNNDNEYTEPITEQETTEPVTVEPIVDEEPTTDPNQNQSVEDDEFVDEGEGFHYTGLTDEEYNRYIDLATEALKASDDSYYASEEPPIEKIGRSK